MEEQLCMFQWPGRIGKCFSAEWQALPTAGLVVHAFVDVLPRHDGDPPGVVPIIEGEESMDDGDEDIRRLVAEVTQDLLLPRERRRFCRATVDMIAARAWRHGISVSDLELSDDSSHGEQVAPASDDSMDEEITVRSKFDESEGGQDLWQ